MSDWRAFLKPEEADQLAAIVADRRRLNREYRLLYDRCRKRMASGTKQENANS